MRICGSAEFATVINAENKLWKIQKMKMHTKELVNSGKRNAEILLDRSNSAWLLQTGINVAWTEVIQGLRSNNLERSSR